MKKILTGLLIFMCFGLVNCMSQAIVVTQQSAQTLPKQVSSLPYGEYLEFYSIDKNNINMSFIALPDEQDRKFMKTLNNTEKENYKYVKKIQKMISKGNWGEVLYKYPDYFPAYVQYYNYCMNQNNFKEALRILIRIQQMDKYAQIFNEDLMNYSIGVLYYNTANYNKALEYFRAYENTGQDYIYSSMANCYFYLGNYSKALEYKKKMKKPAYMDKELMYSAYIKQNDIVSANKMALELLDEKYGFTNLMRLEATSQNDEMKLSYAYTARNTAATEAQIDEVNEIIANLEQKKLDKKTSKITQFVKIPKWNDIKKNFPQNVTSTEISAKQDEFFRTANLYLEHYKGQDLVNAFNSLDQDFSNYIQIKQTQYYKEKELEAQAALLLEQQMRNDYLRQQLIRQQQLRYYMDMDRMDYMMGPYMGPRYYGMW